MRNVLRGLALVAVLAMGSEVLVACQLDPAKVEGALPGEANELRVIQAALTVKAANETIGQQLDLGVITVTEATRLRVITKQAEAAIAAARVALPLENGDTASKLAALNQILLQLLREQVIKAGAK